jgi:hypothetical protein
MLIAWILITCLGILLGKHFRVFVLAPAFAAGAITVSAAAMAGQISMFEALGLMVLASVCLQIGYLIGLFLRSPTRRTAASQETGGRPVNGSDVAIG